MNCANAQWILIWQQTQLEAKTNSQKFGEAATVIDRLSVETRVLFWLILAMNAAVIGIFTLVYRNV
jgi:hypothetical protein